jgi:CRISPR-associated protein Cst2
VNTPNRNIFATILTHAAPSSNYRGESEQNRSVIQKVTDGRFEYPIISPEAMRNALREQLHAYGLPCNRTRLHNEEQLSVEFREWPDATKFTDDFFFGYLLALDKKKRTELEKSKGKEHPFKRDSILRMNLAKGLAPYRHDAIFTQSPKNSGESPWQNADSSALLHRETAVTAFQYPLAINLNDVFAGPGPEEAVRKKWLAALLRAISELSAVAGNHARSLFHMEPASIVLRVTDRLVPGYVSYGFEVDEEKHVTYPEVVDGIVDEDLPANEFYIGGTVIRKMPKEIQKALAERGTNTYRTAVEAIDAVCLAVTGIAIPGVPTRGRA